MSNLPKISYFQIHFSSSFYYAGQTLSGTVQLELNRPMQATQLKLEISGGVNIKWKEDKNDDKITYKSEALYLNHTRILWQRKHEKDAIDKGKYVYDFSVPIPANTPSSFAFPPKASISYYARAVISRESFFKSDEVINKFFTVVSLLDLNSTPQLNRGLQVVHGNGKISLTVLMAKSGFVPGETINLEARLANNSSSKKIEKIEAALYQNVNMKAYKRGQVHKKMHEKCKEALVLHRYLTVDMAPNTPNRQVFWDLKIPRVSPTLQTCDIINVNYTLILNLHISGIFTEPVRVKFPIVLGTVALREQQQTVSAPPVQQPPPVQEYNTDLLMELNLPPPPSYSECMKSSD